MKTQTNKVTDTGGLPPELESLVIDAESAVTDHRRIHDAIGAAKTDLSRAVITFGLAKEDFSGTLADEVLGAASADDVKAAEDAVESARKAVERQELLMSGLQSELVDVTAEAKLIAFEKDLGETIPGLATAAISEWQAKYDRAYQQLRGLIAEGSALSTVAGRRHLVDTTPVRPLAPGQSLPHDPAHPVVELLVPKFDYQSALTVVTDTGLRRVVDAHRDLGWALGLISGERTRRQREASRAERASNGGRRLHRTSPLWQGAYSGSPRSAERPVFPGGITREQMAGNGGDQLVAANRLIRSSADPDHDDGWTEK
jgi:hypothetical protein